MSKILEKTFVVSMLFYTTGAFLPFLTPRLSRYSGFGSSAVNFAIQSAFYAVAFCFIGVRWRTVLQGAWNAKWILALLMVAFASTAWSQDPIITLRRAAVLCATTVFGIYFAARFDVPNQLRLLAWTCGLVVCVSFLCAIYLPHYGIDQAVHSGDWQGAFYQKNILARAMVLSALVFFSVRFRSGNTLRWIGIAGSLTLLVLSRSATGIIVFAVILTSWPLYRLFRTKFTFAVPVAAAGLMVLMAGTAVAYKALPTILEMMNRDEGLTGRFDLWNMVWVSILRKPWLGYGFDAFWQGMRGESVFVIQAVGWVPLGGAHNGFLELLLEMGFVGLAVFAVGYFLLWRRALQLVTRVGGNVPIWLCTYLFFMLIYNFTENTILAENSIFWVLYTCIAVNLYLDSPAKQASDGTSWSKSSSQSGKSEFMEETSCA
jgi:exopolysaccharide production protein ExoQ